MLENCKFVLNFWIESGKYSATFEAVNSGINEITEGIAMSDALNCIVIGEGVFSYSIKSQSNPNWFCCIRWIGKIPQSKWKF